MTQQSKANVYAFNPDTIVVSDTLFVANSMFTVSNTLIIRNTFKSTITVDSSVVNKETVITDYFILPLDTLIIPEKQQNVSLKKKKQLNEKVNDTVLSASTKSINDLSLKDDKSNINTIAPQIIPTNNNDETAKNVTNSTVKDLPRNPVNNISLAGRSKKSTFERIADKKKTTKKVADRRKKQKNVKAIEVTTKKSIKPEDTKVSSIDKKMLEPKKVKNTRSMGKMSPVKKINNKKPKGGFKITDDFSEFVCEEDDPSLEEVEAFFSGAKTAKATTKVQHSAIAADTSLPQKIEDADKKKTNENNEADEKKAYDNLIVGIEAKRKVFAKDYQNTKKNKETKQVIKNAGEFLEISIGKNLMQYWNGQKYQDKAYTFGPNGQKMESSYLILNLLSETGFKIDHQKFKEINELKAVQLLGNRKKTKQFTYINELEDFVTNKGKGLYVLSFDEHTGFLYNDGKKMFLICKVSTTVILISTKYAQHLYEAERFSVNKLSDNTKLIEKWLLQEPLTVDK